MIGGITMSRVTELEKALTTLFRKGTEVGYTETEIDEFLENIDYHALLQAVWNKAETVYAYRADGKNALSLDYRSAELFKQRATLLYLPFINLLRSINSIPILLLTYEKVCAVAPDILRFHCTEASSDELLENGADVESRKPPITIIKAAEMELHLEQRVAMLCGNELALTPKEFDILSLLISNPKRVFTYEMIIDIVWHEDLDFYSQRVIHHHISNINRKIRQICSGKKYIKSIYGVGYKFDV